MRFVGYLLGVVMITLSACQREPSETDLADQADGPEALSPAALDQATQLITDDLNLPIDNLHAALARAASDEVVSHDELRMQGFSGFVPLAPWLVSRGFIRAESEQAGDYGLTDRGRQFLRSSPPRWFGMRRQAVSPMTCVSGGSATSASCTAELTYQTVVAEGLTLADEAAGGVASLQMAFNAQSGWQVENLVVDSGRPGLVAERALFGDLTVASRASDDLIDAAYQAADARMTAALDAEHAQREAVMVRKPEDVPTRPTPPGPAAATTASAPRVTEASIIQSPSAEALSQAYPGRALAEDVTGQATIACTVTTAGRLEDCQATREFPVGYRFGQAAVSLAPHYRLQPRRQDGRSVASRIQTTVRFSIQD